ncbi:MAG TPA: alpha/beta hydrolase [Patescibacteria group bacterium]|nr:alpha/beta hydrolase [Patescibacteria group bacterium]
MNKTIIFITGAWLTPKCWNSFKSFFTARGYNCLAPAWPAKAGDVAAQNASPDPALANLGLTEIADYYEKIIRAQEQPPILIGHSFGGLLVQLLLDRSLGAAGIAIDSAAPKGVFALYPSAVWANRRILAVPGGWHKIVRCTPQDFHFAFAHTLSRQEALKLYLGQVVPETGRIFWQAALAPFHRATQVDFRKPGRAPLLLLAGELDRLCPAAMNRENYLKYQSGRVDYHAFAGRTHWIIGQPGWEEAADYCLSWLQKTDAAPGRA